MTHNVVLQQFFSPMTEAGAHTPWFADEFGLAVPLAAAVCALYYWRKGTLELDRVRGS